MRLPLIILAASLAFGASDDEFVGPFPSWTNLVTSYGTSNTAIQNALNDLGTPGHSHVLYVPCGTYTISTTLTITSKEGVSVLGADPTCVTFQLSGAGPILHVNGVDYSKFNRITFDLGGNTSAIAIEQANNSGTFFDTGNQYTDDVFRNGGTGIRCGWLVNGCSEVTIIRDQFTNLANIGVFVGNYNALDIWIRYSVFDNCKTAVGNYDGTNVGAGNFHIYNSILKNSTLRDVGIANTLPFSFRDSYFANSPFAIWGAGTGNPAEMTIASNTFIDQSTQAILMQNQGPVLLMDNATRQSSMTLPAANISEDGIAVGNRFTLGPNPITAVTRLFESGTQIVAPSTINATEPTLPGFQPNLNRQVFEVAAGASTATIQTAINNACALNGNRPVVHIPESSYSISQQLFSPPNCDAQLTGDGFFATLLNWTGGTGNGPALLINGPSHVTLRDLRVNANLQVDAIGASGIDQAGSRVFIEGSQMGADNLAANANLFYEGLDNTVLDIEDAGHGGSTGTGVKVIGGPLAAAGTPVTGMVRFFSGSGSSETLPYSVSNGGTLLLRDYWNESAGPAFASISGRALVTFDNVHAFLGGNTGQATPGISISNLNGKASILTSNPQDRTVISGVGTQAQVLQAAGDQDCTVIDPYFIDNSFPAGANGLLNHRECTTSVPGSGSIPTANTGSADPTFIASMLAQTRVAHQAPLITLAPGITDIRMYRVATNRGINGIHLIGSGQCLTDANGFVITGLSAIQNNLLGPLTCSGSSPWIFGDLAETGTADNMAPAALAEAPALGTALAGTVSHTSGTQTITTTADLTGPLAGQSWVVVAWNSVDGAGTGRALCPIQSVSATTITCAENLLQPNFSGVTAYLLPPPDVHGHDFQSWTTENPLTVWNYYDVGIALYRLYYRTLNATYLTQARAYSDISWQWTLDHGYRSVAPRASTMLSQFFRAGEGHTERLPGLYNWIVGIENSRWLSPALSPAIDNREAGYQLWANVDGAKVDTDPTRHAAYCSAVSSATTTWNSVQAPDGSFPENEFALNSFYISAPKTFTAPFLYQGAPWRQAINIKSLEAAYESLNDTSTQGCNNTSLAASTLTTITKAVTWQWNYGRDTSNRGIYYEVNSQSDDQASVSPATGTVSATLTSTAVVGVGTNWNSSGHCDGTHFIGFYSSATVYKIASCTDNTHATISVPFGLYGEMSNVSASQFGIAPAAVTTCHSSATYCGSPASNTNPGDRNLTRTVAGDIGWLYAQTLNPTYQAWTNEFLSAQLGGPTTGLTPAATIGSMALPCSGSACDGLVTDTVAAAANCGSAPCVNGAFLYTNLGKNYGEAFGAPGIDNALAWRLLAPSSPTITSTSPLPSGIVGTPYSFQFAATGTTPITWTCGSLPSWASCSSSGALTGTPATTGTSTISVSASNSGGSAGPIFFSLTINGALPTITSTSPLPSGTLNAAYSFQFAANGTPPITWSATGLPSWASLSSSGLLTGTPNAIATTIFAVRATNTTGTTAPMNFSITIAGIAPTITSTSPLPGGSTGIAYSFQFAASGSTPITWSATGLPGWANLSSSGLLTGTPNAAAVSTLVVTAINTTGTSGPHSFSLTIVTSSVAPTITTTSPLPNGIFGSAYSFQFSANGTAPITWSATGLPGWASLSSGGALTGTPNAIAVSTLHVTATNGTGSDGPHDFSLTVPGIVPTITSLSPLPGGTTQTAYSYQFTATGTTPITWSVGAGLPAWATLSSSGLLSGTPISSGTSTFPITATNATGNSGPISFSLTVVSSLPSTLTCSPKTNVTPPNVADVQFQSNMALGTTTCTNNITQTGSCNATDVQRVVNALLGQACIIGP